jgi:type VI protein secretion system component Hcp
MAAAHTAVFELEGAKAQVLDLGYSFSRATDPEKGQPVKVVRNGQIVITVRSDEKELVGKIINWMGKQDQAKAGSITIYKDAEQTKELKKIEFENAYVVGYEERFNSQGDSDNTLETFRITAEKIKVSGAEFKMKWPDSE